MQNNDNSKKTIAVSDFLHKASDIGKKGVDSVKKGVVSAVEQSKSNIEQKRMKKLNPLFPEIYKSDDFHRPNMIIIVDDAVRRDEKLCKGAIGWTNKDNGMEVLYLYDEAVAFSGIEFVPTVTCDAIYYVDNFDKNRYIRTDCIFSKAHEEKIAELKYIAYSLGAKRCSIEISEAYIDINKSKRSFSETINSSKMSSKTEAEIEYRRESGDRRSGRTVIDFGENSMCQRPVLKWFKHDDNVNRLIEMRCSGENSIKSECLELSGASSSTMSHKTAGSIDNVISKLNSKSKFNMVVQVEKEQQSKLIYNIEF